MTEYPSKRADVRLFIRAQRPADWEALYEMREQPGVRPGVLSVPFGDREWFRERVSKANPSSHRLIADAYLSDGPIVVIGNLGLHLNKLSGADRADIGIQVHQDYQDIGVGNALMTAAIDLADNWLNLHRLDLEVFSDNDRAIGLYKKFGFEIEATERRDAFRDGAYVDTYWMGRLNPAHLHPKAQP
jgi:putative acetyltransferase